MREARTPEEGPDAALGARATDSRRDREAAGRRGPATRPLRRQSDSREPRPPTDPLGHRRLHRWPDPVALLFQERLAGPGEFRDHARLGACYLQLSEACGPRPAPDVWGARRQALIDRCARAYG